VCKSRISSILCKTGLWEGQNAGIGPQNHPSNASGVAASRQSAAGFDGNLNGGFLPKAAKPAKTTPQKLAEWVVASHVEKHTPVPTPATLAKKAAKAAAKAAKNKPATP
jgi:hypothetical protein